MKVIDLRPKISKSTWGIFSLLFIIHYFYFSWKHAGFRYLLKTKYCIIACSDLELEGLAINMQIHQTKKHKGFDIHVAYM